MRHPIPQIQAKVTRFQSPLPQGAMRRGAENTRARNISNFLRLLPQAKAWNIPAGVDFFSSPMFWSPGGHPNHSHSYGCSCGQPAGVWLCRHYCYRWKPISHQRLAREGHFPCQPPASQSPQNLWSNSSNQTNNRTKRFCLTPARSKVKHTTMIP